jgi:hypothetical protein
MIPEGTPIIFTMSNSISGTHSSQVSVTPPVVRQPQPPIQKPPTTSLPQDTFTPKSSVDVDHDGDSK